MDNNYKGNPTLQKHDLVSRLARGENIPDIGRRINQIDYESKTPAEKVVQRAGEILAYII